jgi:hypothetical protein
MFAQPPDEEDPMDDVSALIELTAADDRARRASDLIERHQNAIGELSRIRREALNELLSQGMTQTQVAERLGMTRSRVGQLLSSGPKPARAFLGAGTLTIAVGGKFEAEKTGPEPVVSAQMFATYETLTGLGRSYDLDSEYEFVPPPGLVELNRTNLVVLGSPRILPFVGQVLAADPNVGFGSDENGWYLLNRRTGEQYRSAVGHRVDYGYLGRLPRPDGRGTFLYLAGIHAMGTLGVGQFLTESMEDLYAEVKTRRFSMLVVCECDRMWEKVTKVTPLTPAYRIEGLG